VTHTLEEARQVFAELFELIDGLTAEVHRWGATADGVPIELTLSGMAGGKPISWDVVDRVQSSRPTWRRIETESE
jgi:hypothetical protein